MVRNTKIHNRFVENNFIENQYLSKYNKDLALVEMFKKYFLIKSV
jgi:hypothetical protein